MFVFYNFHFLSPEIHCPFCFGLHFNSAIIEDREMRLLDPVSFFCEIVKPLKEIAIFYEIQGESKNVHF